jgi:hypothetical protein
MAAEWNATGDTVLFWPNDTLLNGQRFTVSDSAGVIDTLVYRPPEDAVQPPM